MPVTLKFTNPWGETYWFQHLGMQWPHNPMRRFIDATTPDKSLARVFDHPEEAREALVVAGSPVGWTVEDAP